MDQADPAKCFARCDKLSPPDPPSESPRCVYLGDAVGEVKVQCETCRGRVMIKWPAHVCEAVAGGRGRCLPTFVPADLGKWRERKPESDIYRLCDGCPDSVPLPP